jgi:hypothetical protein
MYHDEPARSEISTMCNHRGIGRSTDGAVRIIVLLCSTVTIDIPRPG